MVIDTVSLLSPELPGGLGGLAGYGGAVYRSAVRCATGEVEWELTSAELVGSWDHRVRVVEVDGGRQDAGASAGRRLRVDGSVHKAMLGHNVFGGPEDLRAACFWLVARLERVLGVSLPPADVWEVHRADWAEVFDLGSPEAVEEYLRGLGGVRFPRRTVARWGHESVSVPGTSTTVRLYAKGPEFARHDYVRVRRFLGDRGVAELQAVADRCVRVEVEARRKLKDDFGCWPMVSDLETDYLVRLYDREVERLLRESEETVEIVRTHQAVSQRLFEVYSSRLATVLFGTWLQFAALGEDVAREHMPRATYFRHRRLLQDAGVSWQGADVCVVQRPSAVPADFSPRRSDPRRLAGECDQVRAELAAYRVA